MEISELISALEGILFAAGDPVPVYRIAAVLGVGEEIILECARKLGENYDLKRRGIRIVRLQDSLQMCSAPEYAGVIGRVLESRRPPKLSQPALEVLAIVAYFQPVTRAYIDNIRGVDSSYTVGMLTERGLITTCGKLDVPGRPTLYKTDSTFLRTMGIESLEELVKLPDLATDDGQCQLRERIDEINHNNDNTGKLKILEGL